MNETAIRVVTLDDNDNPDQTVNFLEHEVLATLLKPISPVNPLTRRVDGEPRQLLHNDYWVTIEVDFRIHDETTAAKLATLKAAVLLRRILRLYPIMRQDQASFYDCTIPIEIPTAWLSSGRYVTGNQHSLVFSECSKAGQVVVSDDSLS